MDLSGKEPGKSELVLINPEIIEKIGEKFLREGCLSVQSLTANVKRADEVVVEWMGMDGKMCVHRASGIEAICVQHELDHLDGKLLMDRVTCLKTDLLPRKNPSKR